MVKLFTGSSNKKLSTGIAKHLGIKLSDIDILRFSDGEIRCEINECVRGQKVFILQSTCSPTNDNLMELLIIADALHRSGAKEIVGVIPYYGYARQDRRPEFSRTPITSSLVAKMIQVSHISQIVTIDLHSGQQQGFFDIPITNISASPVLIADIWKTCSMEDVVVVSPDVGGVARARVVAKQLNNAPLAIIDKRREDANQSEVMNIIGDVDGKDCILVDDMIDTAGTLCGGAMALKQAGANVVKAYASHQVFSGRALENIEYSVLDEVIVTDTIPHIVHPKIVRVVSVVELLAETIFNIDCDLSVSKLFV